MSEISMYEAQKKKMQGLCDEHDLVYRFEKDRYPIIFTIKPAAPTPPCPGSSRTAVWTRR